MSLFRARKTNILTLCGFRKDRIGVTVFPAALKTLSDGVLVVQIHMHLRVTLESSGNLHWLLRHQGSGFAFESMTSLSARALLGMDAEVVRDFSRSPGVFAADDTTDCPSSPTTDVLSGLHSQHLFDKYGFCICLICMIPLYFCKAAGSNFSCRTLHIFMLYVRC